MEPEGSVTRRLFVGVPVPDRVSAFISAAQSVLPPVRGLRLTGSEQWHVTLAFIGRADDRSTEKAQGVVLSAGGEVAGEAALSGFLFLPSPKRVRVVALAVEDLSGVLDRLFELVVGGLEEQGVTEREKRPFRPHVTVARLKNPSALQPSSDCGKARFRVESICLYESELRREGARYKVLARTVLKSADGQETA